MYFLGPKVKNAICDGTPPTCTSNLIYMSAELHRIKLSQIVEVLLHFSDLEPCGLDDGAGVGVSRGMGVPHKHGCTCAYMHIHAKIHMGIHLWVGVWIVG